MLLDKFGRDHTYLRISLTDICNFRCSYCMPHGLLNGINASKLMQIEEIEEIAKVFVSLGIKKIRLTGGEPLLRHRFDEIAIRLSSLPIMLSMTTNGLFIDRHLDSIIQAGIRSINVSMDALDPYLFSTVTDRNVQQEVWRNILLLLENGISVKVNAVAISGVIEKEILRFVELTRRYPIEIRFIEFMPFAGNKWQSSEVVTADQMLSIISQQYDIQKVEDEPNSTAKKYRIEGFWGSIAFITTMSDHFCSGCNRLRLTADGKMKSCIFGEEEVDILTAFRAGDPIEPLILQSVQGKHKAMGGQFTDGYGKVDPQAIRNRSMVSIGG